MSPPIATSPNVESGVTLVHWVFASNTFYFSTLPTNAQGNYPVDKNEQLRRKSLHFGALKRNSTSSSIYEEVKLYLQTRLDTRDYSTSFDSGNSDDDDDQETLSYDVSFHEDREK